jgi:VIT1/CCC1 family predicted Fe2+/Mn2+ transporter
MTHADATAVVNKLSQYENVFVDTMLTEELGHKNHSEDSEHVLSDAFILFFSSLFFGLLPVFVCLVGAYAMNAATGWTFSVEVIAPCIGLLLLLILGAMKGSVTHLPWGWSSGECVFVGLIAYSVTLFVTSSVWHFAMQLTDD